MNDAAIVLAGGAQQIGASLGPAVLVALAFIVPAAGLSWWLKRRSRVTHLVLLPPAREGEPVIDDTLPMVFERGPGAGDDVREAIELMEREWREKKGERRA